MSDNIGLTHCVERNPCIYIDNTRRILLFSLWYFSQLTLQRWSQNSPKIQPSQFQLSIQNMCKQVYIIYQCGHDELPKFYNCFDRPCQGVIRVIIKESNLSLCPRCSAIVIFGKSVYWISSILCRNAMTWLACGVTLLISNNWAVENQKQKEWTLALSSIAEAKKKKKTLCVVHGSRLEKKKIITINFETLLLNKSFTIMVSLQSHWNSW